MSNSTTIAQIVGQQFAPMLNAGTMSPADLVEAIRAGIEMAADSHKDLCNVAKALCTTINEEAAAANITLNAKAAIALARLEGRVS